jgi:AraC-like DNA-binding protein
MFEKWLAGRGADATSEARRLVRKLSDGVETPGVTDQRVVRATQYINTHLDGALTLDEVAEVACLSPSRFRHLFSEQVGMGLRPYILWRRFLLVWEVLMEGKTLSEAAHAAGFADAAHLSRTSVRNLRVRAQRDPGWEGAARPVEVARAQSREVEAEVSRCVQAPKG